MANRSDNKRRQPVRFRHRVLIGGKIQAARKVLAVKRGIVETDDTDAIAELRERYDVEEIT